VLTRGPESRALVLGGGGVTGIAWTTGLLLGLEDGGVDLGAADLVLGTSAGATVGAQLTSGVPLADLFERQVDPARMVPEIAPRIRYLRLLPYILSALLARKDVTRMRRRIGRMALAARTIEPRARHEVIEARLPVHAWPERPLAVAAIDAVSGELRWLDAASGASLVDAVAASCAVPGAWPCVEIDGRRYFDGGLPSPDNTEGAAGCGPVLLVSPLGGDRSGRTSRRVQQEIAALEATGARATLLRPDASSLEAMGRRALDPPRRPLAARAGLEQGRRQAAEVAAGWSWR